MLALHDLQSHFANVVIGTAPDGALAALIVADGLAPAARLGIHRNTARSVAIESLRLTYPATEAVVGRDFFAMAAARFWRARPPRQAWLTAWGGDFPRFLGRLRGAAALPYLSDLARFEWALARAASADDAAPLDPASLAALPAELLCFVAHPSVSLLRLRHPADRIADAVLAGDDDAMAAIDLADRPVRLVVHRARGGVQAERVDAAAFAFLRRLFAGVPLGTLLGRARGVDAAALLAAQFARGRLVAATLQESSR